MELKYYISILWRRKWIIVLTVSAVIVIVALKLASTAPIYEAISKIRVITGGSDDRVEYGELMYSERLLNTYSQIVTSNPVFDELKRRLQITEVPEVTVDFPANTEFMLIIVESTDPVLASESADELARILISYTKEDKTGRSYTASLVDPSVVPREPSKPNKTLTLILGVMVGGVAGLGLAFLFENLDTTIHTTAQIEDITQRASIGKIPLIKKQKELSFVPSDSAESESFRQLRTRIFSLRREEPFQTLLFASAEPSEGKTMIVSNLAVTIAQSGRTIAIVDGNLRLPRLHSLFGLRNDVGLSSVLKRETEAKNALQKSSIPGIYVLTSGPIPPHPAELLGSPQMHALVEYLKSEYDMVLIDSPSILSVADATVITLAVDGVIFVVGRALAQRELVKAALEQLHSLKSKIYGVIVNRSEYIGNYQYYQSMQRRRRRQRRIIP